jgi:NADH dehydrogenase/NADH:ubiquinone oxidoreductase subunit G
MKIKINGRECELEDKKMTLLDAAKTLGIYIPTLCYHPRVSISGSCRLCAVEVEGLAQLQTACTLELKDGMKIYTNSERVKNAVKFNLGLLRMIHPDDCQTCEVNGRCELQDLFMRFDVKREDIEYLGNAVDIYDDSSTAILRDLSK